MIVGPLIQIYRKENRFSVRQLAKIIGISTATLSRVERGYKADGETVIKIIGWIFRGQDNDR